MSTFSPADWMAAISDDAPLCRLAIPGSLDAGTDSLPKHIRRQNGDLCAQFACGVRYFQFRLDTDRSGRPVICRGVFKGEPLWKALKTLRTLMDENPRELLLIDLAPCRPLELGFARLTFSADPAAVDPRLQETLDPMQYAMIDFEKLTKLTVGDMRRTKKRYLLLNRRAEYLCTVSPRFFDPCCGYPREDEPAQDYAKAVLRRLAEKRRHPGFIRLTPEKLTGGPFNGKTDNAENAVLQAIRLNAPLLQAANIIADGFMTDKAALCRRIIALNLDKGFVREEDAAAFKEGFEA